MQTQRQRAPGRLHGHACAAVAPCRLRRPRLPLATSRKADAHTSLESACREAGVGPQLIQHLLKAPLHQLMEEAAALRDHGHRHITFSPKVFIPLTRLCRDSCGYCTFARPPAPGQRAYMTLEEVLQVAALGAQQGCTEALFTLGDKPELLYPVAAEELASMGYSSTLEYVEAAAAAVLQQTGLLPHINAGVMSAEQVARLKEVSASQGLMLEGVAPALAAPGGAHHNCPDKEPAARLATIAAAGEQRVPYTSGILLGIGETREERLVALLQLLALHQHYGHLQELIIQNFRAKPNTAMAHWAEPPLEELLWSAAAARLLFGPHMNIQAPPNLTPATAKAVSGANGSTTTSSTSSTSSGSGSGSSSSSSRNGEDNGNSSISASTADTAQQQQQADELEASWRALLDAGINDWGGISPVTKDHVNPEKSWPHLSQLAAVTALTGKPLLPRLPVYPQYALDLTGAWLSHAGGQRSVAAAVLSSMDGEGLVRGSDWCAGMLSTDDGATSASDNTDGDVMEASSSTATTTNTTSSSTLHEGSTSSSYDSSAADRRIRSGSSSPSSSGSDSSSSSGSKPASPPVRLRASKTWQVAMDSRGLIQGVAGPTSVSPDVQQLLDEVLASAAHNQTPAGNSSLRWNHQHWLQQQQHDTCQQNPHLQYVHQEQQQDTHQQQVQPTAAGVAWDAEKVALLLSARGADMDAVLAAADELRHRVCGDKVTYVVNRNINYTNVCTYGCKFCAFSKGKASEELRGAPYLVPLEEISRRASEAWERGATEVCMQGGIHPEFTGDTYLQILRAAKAGAPDIHVHAFSPLEVTQGARTLGLSLPAYLQQLKAAGLGSLPGTAAEVLVDDVRQLLCPDKLSTREWLEVVAAAHAVGLPTTSTIMFGSVEPGPAAVAQHLLELRQLAAATGGISEFVPLPFVHMEAPIYLKGAARRGPTLRECLLLHAVARLVLHPLITNIQASWVKMGPHLAAQLLRAGCNDMGGTLMNESITRAAGAAFGQELPPGAMTFLIQAAERTPVQRTTLYGQPTAAQVKRSFAAGPLAPVTTVPAF